MFIDGRTDVYRKKNIVFCAGKKRQSTKTLFLPITVTVCVQLWLAGREIKWVLYGAALFSFAGDILESAIVFFNGDQIYQTSW